MMAKTPEVSVRDIDRVRLLTYELKVLAADMKADRCKHGERLATITRRFAGTRFEDDR